MTQELKPLRKGARGITVNGVEFGWMVGRGSVEIRNRQTNKAVHVPRTQLEGEDRFDTAGIDPATIKNYIVAAGLA